MPNDQPSFDFDDVFDEDYLYFYEASLTPELNERQAGLIARLLGLAPGDNVLDVPCGHGRIANQLAAGGARVVGLDASAAFLERARRDAAALGVEVTYVEGDMRDLVWSERFDAVVNWFTSFGYFDDDTNRKVLREFRRVLRPGGRLLLDHQNRDRIVRLLPAGSAPLIHLTERDGDLMIDSLRFDAVAGATETERVIVRGGRVRRATFTVRIPAASELREWLGDAGFPTVEFFGADGEQLTPESRRMILVATAG